MPARSIASLSLTFGLVSIPIKLYSATESSAAIRFKLMASSGARLRQQYVADVSPVAPPERAVAKPPGPALKPAAALKPGPAPNPGAGLKLVDFRHKSVPPPSYEPPA